MSESEQLNGPNPLLSSDLYFPDELLLLICSQLPVDDLKNARLVCRQWNLVASDDFLWERLFKDYIELSHKPSRKSKQIIETYQEVFNKVWGAKGEGEEKVEGRLNYFALYRRRVRLLYKLFHIVNLDLSFSIPRETFRYFRAELYNYFVNFNVKEGTTKIRRKNENTKITLNAFFQILTSPTSPFIGAFHSTSFFFRKEASNEKGNINDTEQYYVESSGSEINFEEQSSILSQSFHSFLLSIVRSFEFGYLLMKFSSLLQSSINFDSTFFPPDSPDNTPPRDPIPPSEPSSPSSRLSEYFDSIQSTLSKSPSSSPHTIIPVGNITSNINTICVDEDDSENGRNEDGRQTLRGILKRINRAMSYEEMETEYPILSSQLPLLLAFNRFWNLSLDERPTSSSLHPLFSHPSSPPLFSSPQSSPLSSLQLASNFSPHSLQHMAFFRNSFLHDANGPVHWFYIFVSAPAPPEEDHLNDPNVIPLNIPSPLPNEINDENVIQDENWRKDMRLSSFGCRFTDGDEFQKIKNKISQIYTSDPAKNWVNGRELYWWSIPLPYSSRSPLIKLFRFGSSFFLQIVL